MKYVLPYSAKTLQENAMYVMSLYIGYLSCRKINFFDFHWKSDVFCFQSFMETDGAILFSKTSNSILGAYRENIICSQNPTMFARKAKTAFADAENVRKQDVQYLLSYMITAYEEDETPSEKITTAIWSVQNTIYSCDAEDTFSEYSGGFLKMFGRCGISAIEEYFVDEYAVTPEQIHFARTLWEAKKKDYSIKQETVRPFLSKCVNPSLVEDAIRDFGICAI